MVTLEAKRVRQHNLTFNTATADSTLPEIHILPVRKQALGDMPHAFSTCPKSSSTGVDRPKIVTDTLILLLS